MLGAPKKCFKCEKLVYPVEELKCLDKVWHKSCFKCTVCASVLNIKNYKGFDKQPYCATHYPQQKPTVVTDNPEMQRIKENTKLQSQAKYHEDFEKSKGTYISISDDPEMRRAIENSKIISQVKYHEDFEKSKNKFTQVADTPETQRAIENQKIVSSVEYKNMGRGQRSDSITSSTASTSSASYATNNNVVTYKAGERTNGANGAAAAANARKIGSITDYDPMSKEAVYTNAKSNANSGSFRLSDVDRNSYSNGFSNGSTVKIVDDGFNNNHSSVVNKNYCSEPVIPRAPPNTTVYRAIYDHDAKEDDEISFRDGDRFLECQIIDEGWMVGRHERSGKYGLFPSNYAEPVDIF